MQDLLGAMAEDNNSNEAIETTSLCDPRSDSTQKIPPLWKSSRRQIMIIVALFCSNVYNYMRASVLAPFFPEVANKKYMPKSLSGWVFGVFPLAQFFFSPIVGLLIPRIGSRFLLVVGTFLAGGSSILFGFLDWVPATQEDNMAFTLLCFLLRISVSLGCTAATTATFAIATHTFPDNAATVMAILDSALSLGLILGPVIGGLLYGAGGFLLPYVLMGGFMLVSIPIFVVILPQYKGDGEREEEPASVLALLRVPVIFLNLIIIWLTAHLWMAMDSTLESFLWKFQLSAPQVGLVFLLTSGTYSVLAPLSGWIADHMENSTPLIIMGFAVLSVGLLLIGPSPMIGFGSYSKLWLVLVSLVNIGVGISLTIVPTYEKVLTAARDNGFPDNIGTKGTLAGLWVAVYALGDFSGAVYAGEAVEVFGFPLTMTFLAGACILMFILCSFFYMYEYKRKLSMQKDLASHHE